MKNFSILHQLLTEKYLTDLGFIPLTILQQISSNVRIGFQRITPKPRKMFSKIILREKSQGFLSRLIVVR